LPPHPSRTPSSSNHFSLDNTHALSSAQYQRVMSDPQVPRSASEGSAPDEDHERNFPSLGKLIRTGPQPYLLYYAQSGFSSCGTSVGVKTSYADPFTFHLHAILRSYSRIYRSLETRPRKGR
jgi:hypothetical protein